MKQLFILLFLMYSSFLHAELVIAFGSKSGKVAEHQKPDLIKLQEIANKHNIDLILKPLPWKRALLLLEKGKIDGVINASYKNNRAIYAHYPMNDGKTDSSKRLNDGDSYYIYKNRDSSLVWDGKKFINPDGAIGVMENYAVIEDLKKHNNITIKEFNENVEIIRSVVRKKLSAYAGSSLAVDNLLREYPILSQQILRESIPIRKKEYFVIFSKITFLKKQAEMEKIWNGLKPYNQKKDKLK